MCLRRSSGSGWLLCAAVCGQFRMSEMKMVNPLGVAMMSLRSQPIIGARHGRCEDEGSPVQYSTGEIRLEQSKSI